MFLGTENSCQILRSPTTKNHRNNLCIYATFLTFGKALGGIFVAWLLSWVDLTDAAEYQGWTVRRETSKKHHIWHSNCLWICSLDSRHILLWKTCWKHQGIISSCLGLQLTPPKPRFVPSRCFDYPWCQPRAWKAPVLSAVIVTFKVFNYG